MGAEEARVVVAHEVRGAVDRALVRQGDALAGAQEVDVLEIEVGGVGAAGAAEAEAPLEGPDVAGDHFQVHRAVAHRNGADAGVVEVAVAAQDALGLRRRLRRVGVPGLHQHLALDDLRLGDDVQPVRQPEERLVLTGLAGIEDVLGDDADLAHRGRLGVRFLALAVL
jgi:hypothetical protein